MLRQDQIPVLVFNIIAFVFFTWLFASRRDYEFLLYLLVIAIVIYFVIKTNRRAKYSAAISWGLSIWGVMHLAGSGIYISGVKLYEQILIPISLTAGVLRYDQVVHTLGMTIFTIAVANLFRGYLNPDYLDRKFALALLIISVGLGVGAANEIIEFIVTLIITNNGVGGYLNTSIDHISNLFGILIGLAYIFSVDNRIKNNK